MSDTISNPNPSHWNALRKIVKRLPANLAYYGSALGAIVLAGGGQLPPGLEFVAGGIGGNILSNIISDILKDENEKMPDEEIRQRAEEAIHKSDIANLLTKQDFLQGYARLIQRLDAQKIISQDILDELRMGFSKVATADQVEELKRLILQYMQGYQSYNQSYNKPQTVFISYARADGKPLAEHLRQKITQFGHHAWQDLYDMKPGEGWELQLKEAIESSHTFVLVLTPGALKSKVVREEWEMARHKGIKIIPITQAEDIFQTAPRWIHKNHTLILDVSFNEPTPNALKRALGEPHSRRPVPFVAPPVLPLTTRDQYLNDLKSYLLDESGFNPQFRVVSLFGAGGFGKTSLAHMLCLDSQIVDAFSDGILWATFGEETSSVLGQITEMVSALQGEPKAFHNEAAAAHVLRQELSKRDCLMVLDDVWNVSQIRSFLGSERCAYVITTRVREGIPSIPENKVIPVWEVTTQEAIRILTQGLRDISPHEKELLKRLAKRLGEWPVLLSLVRKDLFRRIEWDNQSVEAAVQFVNQGLDDLKYEAFDRNNESERNASLAKTIQYSLKSFDAANHQRLYELTIFPEDTSIPEQIALRLWSVTAPNLKTLNASRLLEQFAGQFFDFTDRKLRFHDVLRTYLREQLGGEQERLLHQALLTSYNPSNQPWHTVHDKDGYLYANLIYHLEQAGRQNEIHALFCSEGWAKTRSANSLIGLLTDFEKARSIVSIEKDIDTYFRYILFAEVVKQRYQQFPVEALPTALERGWANHETLMTAINSMAGQAEAKVRAYISMADLISPELQRRFSEDILLIAQQVSEYDEDHRLRKIALLQELTPFLHGDARSSVFQMIWKQIFEVEGQKKREKPLAWLLPYLGREQLESLKEDVLKISNIYRRTNIIARIVPLFPLPTQQDLWQSVYNELMAEDLKGYHAGEVFGFVVPRLPAKLQHQVSTRILEVLQSIQFWESYEFFTEIFEPLLPYIPAGDMKELWGRAKSEAAQHDEYWGEKCLISIALHVPSENIPQDIAFDDETQISKYYKETQACIKLSMVNRLNSDQQIKAFLDSWTTLLYEFSGRFQSEEIMLQAAAKLSPEAAAVAWHFTLAVEAKHDADGDTKRYLYHRKTDALVGLAYRLPTELIASACIECISPQRTRETLIGGSEAGWIKVLRVLTNRLDKSDFSMTDINTIWDKLFTTLVEEPSDEYASNLYEALRLIPLMPERLRLRYWDMALDAIRVMPRLRTRVYVLTEALETVPANMKSQIWIDAQEIAFQSEDISLLHTVIGKFAFVYDHLIPEHRNKIMFSDWKNGLLANALIEEASESDGYRYWRNSEGLALLLLLSPSDFVTKVWNVLKSKIGSNGYEGGVYLSIVLFPFVPITDQELLLRNLLRNGWIEEDERIDKLKPLFGRWTEEAVWCAWQYMQQNVEGNSEWYVSNWAKFLTPFLTERYVTQAWDLALQRIFPMYWFVWPEICGQLATQLPITFLPTAWRQLEEFERQKEHWSFGRDIKAAMAPRLPDEFLLSLAQRAKSQSKIPRDIFICSTAKYIRYGAPWFGSDVEDLLEDNHEGLLFRFLGDKDKNVERFLKFISYLCYLTIPLTFIFLIVMQPFKWLHHRITVISKSMEEGLYTENRKIWLYLRLGVLIFLNAILVLPLRVIRYFGNLLGLVFESKSRVLRILFVISLMLFGNNIAWNYFQYASSETKRVSQIEKVTNIAELATQRPILQIMGKRKLRKLITDSYYDAQTWWKEAVTWVEL